MKTQINALSVLLLSLSVTLPILAEGQIKLTGRKDLVLGVESRANALDVARLHLSEKNDNFLDLISTVQTPYAFEQPPEAVLNRNGGGEQPVEEAVINYDDASVLRAVANNFAQQVRGTLARGTTSFLQLKGGSMIKPGTSFPVSIPQAQGQTFTVTISEITSDTYTLQLGEAIQTISLNAASSGSGAMRMD